MKYLFSFVSVDPGFEFNELLAGYFNRAAITLIRGKPREMFEFFEKYPNIINDLFVHSNNQSISDVLCKILTMDSSFIDNPLWLDYIRKDILEKILTKLSNSDSIPYDINQLSQTFCDLCEQSMDIQGICCNFKIAKALILLSLNESCTTLEAGIRILTKLLSMENSKFAIYLKQELDDTNNTLKSSNSGELLSLMNSQLERFKDVLLEEHTSFINQYGIEVIPFGCYRLKIIEYIHCIIKLIISPIIDKISQLQYPQFLCKLFMRFPMNSILHRVIFSIFKSIVDFGYRFLHHIVSFYSL